MLSSALLFFASSFALSKGWLYIDEYKTEFNPDLVNQSRVEYFSDKVHPATVNYTIESIKTVNKFKVYLGLNMPENENDREFRKTLLKTVVDSTKFFNDVYANPFVRYLVGSILKSVQFELQLPFKPGVYRFVNVTFGDLPFPLSHMNSTGTFSMRFVGNIDGRKNGIFIVSLWFRGGHLKSPSL